MMILIFCIFCTVCIDFLISAMYVFSAVSLFGWCSRLGPVCCICRLLCLGICTVFGICEWRAICRFTVSSIIYHCLPVISSICYHQLTSTFLYLLKKLKKATFDYKRARVCPMQLLGPIPKPLKWVTSTF